MQKMSKNTAYICIVSIGFALILLLWLPTFVASVKSIAQETNLSSSRVTKQISEQSGQIFEDTGRQLQEKIQQIQEEKEKKDALQATISTILKENLQSAQPLGNTSSSTSSTSTNNTISY